MTIRPTGLRAAAVTTTTTVTTALLLTDGPLSGTAASAAAAYDRKREDAVRLLDVTGDDRAGLAVGAPAENDGTGALWSLRGTTGWLTARVPAAMRPVALGAPADGAEFGTAFGAEDAGHGLYTYAD